VEEVVVADEVEAVVKAVVVVVVVVVDIKILTSMISLIAMSVLLSFSR
jgi:hypothetical protein